MKGTGNVRFRHYASTVTARSNGSDIDPRKKENLDEDHNRQRRVAGAFVEVMQQCVSARSVKVRDARKNELNPAGGKIGLEGQVSAETCTGHNGSISQSAQKNWCASVQKEGR